MDVKNVLTYIFHLNGMKLLLYCTGQKSVLITIFPKENDTGRIWKSGFRPASSLLPSEGKRCTFTVKYWLLPLCQIFTTTALCWGVSPTELHFRHLHLSAMAARSYFSCTKQLK